VEPLAWLGSVQPADQQVGDARIVWASTQEDRHS
jgi:hypothetical protein